MKQKPRWIYLIGILVLLSSILGGLFFWKDSLTRKQEVTPAAVFVPPNREGEPTPTNFTPTTPTATSLPPAIWMDPGLPKRYLDQVALNQVIAKTDQQDGASVWIYPGEDQVISRWIYVLAAPFPTVRDGVSMQDFRAFWQGDPPPDLDFGPLYLTEETRDLFSNRWGEPSPGAVRVVPSGEIKDLAWSQRPTWALLPFEVLDPSWKVLQVGNTSPLWKDFQVEEYPLQIPISSRGEVPRGVEFPAANRDPAKMTSVVMTGVTALVRATAWTMEMNGIEYPAKDIQDWLVDADILHISNEVPFYKFCPQPNPAQEGLKFCSDPKYIRLLERIGTDVVELTGDHFGDYGPEAMLYTLELYQQRGWPYYGGGANRQEAQQPVLLEHHGNQIAFVGCNAKGGGYATAGPSQPGAVACDFPQITRVIEDLTAQGVAVIGTFQHFEYYTYQAQPNQIRDARRLTEAGAVIVSGSQAHQPQSFQITDQAFIHHGLGNLFFDQIYEIPPNTATAFIDRHTFYDGKHLSTELLTIRFEDYARARPMTRQEREVLLETVFQASGW